MKNLAELQALRDSMKNTVGLRDADADGTKIVVGMATCGIAAGARLVLSEFTNEVAKRALSNVTISQTGCIGLCQYEPIVEVFVPGKDKVTYVLMNEEKVARIVTEHIVNGNPVSEFTIGNIK